MDMEQIFEEARRAAANAVAGYTSADEMVGACGFAWVSVRPANSPFVNWCKKEIKNLGFKIDGAGNMVQLKTFFRDEDRNAARNAAHKYGSRGTYGGWTFWNPAEWNGQNVDIKEKGAQAFAKVLQSYGIEAYASSRLD